MSSFIYHLKFFLPRFFRLKLRRNWVWKYNQERWEKDFSAWYKYEKTKWNESYDISFNLPYFSLFQWFIFLVFVLGCFIACTDCISYISFKSSKALFNLFQFIANMRNSWYCFSSVSFAEFSRLKHKRVSSKIYDIREVCLHVWQIEHQSFVKSF